MATHAHLVGMTLASECIVANELGIAYAAVCVVDNMANGIEGTRSRSRSSRTSAGATPSLCGTPSRPCSRSLKGERPDRDRGPTRRGEGRAPLRRRVRSRRWGPRSCPRWATRRSTPGARLLIPALVNGHTHAAMTLFRGYGGDLPLMRWLQEKVWPVEAKLDEEDVYWGIPTRLPGDDPDRDRRASGTCTGSRRRPPAPSPTAACGRRSAARCSTPTARPSGCRARVLAELEELGGVRAGDRPRPRPALDLHRQRRAAALDRGDRRRKGAARPDPPFRDRAGGRGLPRGPRRTPGPLPRSARPARRADDARPRRLARSRRARADRRARRHRRHQPRRQPEARLWRALPLSGGARGGRRRRARDRRRRLQRLARPAQRPQDLCPDATPRGGRPDDPPGARGARGRDRGPGPDPRRRQAAHGRRPGRFPAAARAMPTRSASATSPPTSSTPRAARSSTRPSSPAGR